MKMSTELMYDENIHLTYEEMVEMEMNAIEKLNEIEDSDFATYDSKQNDV